MKKYVAALNWGMMTNGGANVAINLTETMEAAIREHGWDALPMDVFPADCPPEQQNSHTVVAQYIAGEEIEGRKIDWDEVDDSEAVAEWRKLAEDLDVDPGF